MSQCVQCGAALVRRKGEAHTVFARRQFCSVPCRCRHNAEKMRDRSTPLEAVHLELGTQLDNMNDAKVRGRTARGESHGRAKLTEAEVREIRAAAADGETYRSIGARYGVNRFTVGTIGRREKWGHVA